MIQILLINLTRLFYFIFKPFELVFLAVEMGTMATSLAFGNYQMRLPKLKDVYIILYNLHMIV